mgnify:CR=1 FL=1
MYCFLSLLQGVMEHMPSTNLRPTEEEQWDSTHHYRQTIMFSATMARNVEVMARKYLRNPVVITIGSGGKIADSVTQKYVLQRIENVDISILWIYSARILLSYIIRIILF